MSTNPSISTPETRNRQDSGLTYTLDEIDAALERRSNWIECHDDADGYQIVSLGADGVTFTQEASRLAPDVAEFIALARTALPELAAEVKTLWATQEPLPNVESMLFGSWREYAEHLLALGNEEVIAHASRRAREAEKRAEAAEATIQRVQAVAEAIEADDRQSLTIFGQHLTGPPILAAEMIRDALAGPSRD